MELVSIAADFCLKSAALGGQHVKAVIFGGLDNRRAGFAAECFDEFGRGVGMPHDEDVSRRRAEHVRKGLQIAGVIGQHG